MKTPEPMDINERYKYLQLQQVRYAQASRAAKSALLDEMHALTGLNRNYLTQLLQRPVARQPRRVQRSKVYTGEVVTALRVIWEAQNYICAERLTPNLVWTAELLCQAGELAVSDATWELLGSISISTVRRLLGPCAPHRPARHPPSSPNSLQQAIPIHRIPWDIAEPGHLEVDLVFHCGPEARGEFGYTLQCVDVATGWSDRRAILGRSYLVVADALYALFRHLPFPVRELHPDNGSEFINQHLLRFLKQWYPQATLSRGRPGCPNDNRYVEEKNGSVVRNWLPECRLDTVTQIRYLNTVYALMRPYYNYIQPVLHQIAKERVPATATRAAYTRREYDTPQPPLDRLCATPACPVAQQTALRAARTQLNPLALQRQIAAGIAHLLTYPGAQPEQVEDIFETLAYPEIFPEACTALGLTYTPAAPLYPPPSDPARARESSLKEGGEEDTQP